MEITGLGLLQIYNKYDGYFTGFEILTISYKTSYSTNNTKSIIGMFIGSGKRFKEFNLNILFIEFKYKKWIK